MFNNTLTLTVNSVAKVLTRINQDNYGSEYKLVSATEQFVLKIRHSKQTSKNSAGTPIPFDSHNVFVEHTVFGTPTVPEVVRTASVTVRVQKGDDPAQADFLSDALGVLVAAQMAGLVQGES
jgi:hypothetical protein